MTPEETAPRIKAAQKVGGLVAALGGVSGAEDRLELTHDQLRSIVKNICAEHKQDGADCFTEKQMECIHHITFQLFCILDPKTKPPETAIGALGREIGGLSLLKKLGLIGAFIAFLASLIAVLDTGKNLIFGSKSTPGTERTDAGSRRSSGI